MRLWDGDGDGSRRVSAPVDSPVVVRDRAGSSDGHVAERADGVVVVAADVLRRQVAGHVDDQRAGELHEVGSFALNPTESTEGLRERS